MLRRLAARAVKLVSPSGKATTSCITRGNSVNIVSLPKSGSILLTRIFQLNTDLKEIACSPGYFPSDNLDVSAVLGFSDGGVLMQSHIDASPFNLSLLEQFCPSWILHVRDPRAAMLSWLHHCEREDIRSQPSLVLRNFPVPPDAYYDYPLSSKIDWQIDHYFPAQLNWLEAWRSALDDDRYAKRIILTRHEDIIGRDAAFASSILRALGRPVRRPKLPNRDLQTSHFRKGLADEWRSIFTAEQIARTARAMSPCLLKRFRWSC